VTPASGHFVARAPCACGRRSSVTRTRGKLGSRKIGPIDVPEKISARCKPGWTISGIVSRP